MRRAQEQEPNMRALRLGIIASALALSASQAQAAIITYQITGTAFAGLGTLAALNGTSYIATFSYDDSVADTNANVTIGVFPQVRSFTWNVNSGGLVGGAPLVQVRLNNNFAGTDSIQIDLPINTPWDALITLTGPTSVFANANVLPSTLPALSLWTIRTFGIRQLSGVIPIGSLSMGIDTLTLVPVPAMGGLFALAAAGLLALRRRPA
jgi:hypothetical protein